MHFISEKLASIVSTIPHSYLNNETPKHYQRFAKKKPIGGQRIIFVPNEQLAAFQRKIFYVLNEVQVDSAAAAYVRGKNVFTAALRHVGKKHVLKLDVKDFFTSISQKQITKALSGVGVSEEVAELCAKLCTVCQSDESEPTLPIGATTSPILSNIVLISADKRIRSLCIERNISYSRYADDMYFSFDHGRSQAHELISLVSALLQKQDLLLNAKKIRLMPNTRQQLVLGLIVNDRVDISMRAYRKWKSRLLISSEAN